MHGNYEESVWRQQTEARAGRGLRKAMDPEPAIRPVDNVQRPARDELRFEAQDATTWIGAAIIAALP